MSRPLRLEFPGALYHLTARGDRREPIFEDNTDREALLDVFAHGLERFDAACFAYCLMQLNRAWPLIVLVATLVKAEVETHDHSTAKVARSAAWRAASSCGVRCDVL